MSFRVARDMVYRNTPPHGCTAVHITEWAVGGRWELAGKVPDDATEISADAARERLGALADEASVFATRPDSTGHGGIPERIAQLDAMIDATEAWLRAASVGSDTELAWARYGSRDYDFELDKQVAITQAGESLSRMAEHRGDIVARTKMRADKSVNEARERLGALAGKESIVATKPGSTGYGGTPERIAQLDWMIDATVAWLRAAGVGSDAALSLASHQSRDYDHEVDNRVAIMRAGELLSRMVEHRGDIVARTKMRGDRSVDD